MTTLDFIAAAAVARARLMERAVHDPGPWHIRIGDLEVEAAKVRTPSRVVFLATFTETPSGDTDVAWLYCQGEPVSSKEIGDVPGHVPFCIEWAIIGPGVTDSAPVVGG